MREIYIRNLHQFQSAVRLGSTQESKTLEFKAQYEDRDPKSRYELRKDVAALANTWGGTILIGVAETEKDGRRIATSLQDVPVNKTREWIGNTLTSKIQPQPTYDVDDITVFDPQNDGIKKSLIALNVHPQLNGLIAVQDDQDPSWLVFPYRDDHGVKFLSPNEISTRMTSHARRIYLYALEKKIEGRLYISSAVYLRRPENIQEYTARHAQRGLEADAQYQIIDILLQHHQYEAFWTSNFDEHHFEIVVGGLTFSIPLDAVHSLWRRSDGRFSIALTCDLIISKIGEYSDSLIRFH